MIRKYPGVFLLAFIITGIVLADQSEARSWVFLLATVIGCAGGLVAVSRRRLRWAVFLLAVGVGSFSGFHFGHSYYDTGPFHLKSVVREAGSYRVYGRVADWPDLKADRTEIKIEVDSLGREQVHRVSGAVMLKVTGQTTELQRGDRVEFYGRIYPVKEDQAAAGFDYNRYLKLKSVFGVVYLPTLLDVRVDRRSPVGVDHIVDRVRKAISDSFKRNLEPQQAALASGFLIGETRDISVSVYRMFRDSGTLHLLAVSGSNVALVLLFVTFLMRPFGVSSRNRALILLLVTLLFAELSYEEPSVIRASVMAGLVIVARLLGKRYDLNNIIAVAAVIILLVSPAQLFDVGFQLSFVTAWGLILAVPRVNRLFKPYFGRWWYRWLGLPLMISLVAQLFSTPIIAYHFGRVPVISVLANLIIVPLVSLGVVGILVMLLVDLIWPLLGLFVGSLVNLLLKSVVWALEFMGGENMIVLNTGRDILPEELAVWLVLGAYAILVTLFTAVGTPRLLRTSVMTGAVAVNLVLVVAAVNVSGQSVPRLCFTGVPGGVATLVQHSEQARPDLVITGLDARDYPVDEHILMPWLEGFGCDRLHAIFVLSADYRAIDDLLRLARQSEAEEVFVSSGLERSFSDVIGSGQVTFGHPVQLLGSSTEPASPSEPGYYPIEGGLRLVLEEGEIVFVNRIVAGLDKLLGMSESKGTARPGALVIGRPWSPSPSDWMDLRAAGYSPIICSKIERGPAPAMDAGRFDWWLSLPDYIWDLNRLGNIEIRGQSDPGLRFNGFQRDLP